MPQTPTRVGEVRVLDMWDTFMDSTGQIRSQLLDHFHSSSFLLLLSRGMLTIRPPDPPISIQRKSLLGIGFKCTSSDRLTLGSGGCYVLRKRHEISVMSFDGTLLFGNNPASSVISRWVPDGSISETEFKVYSLRDPKMKPVVFKLPNPVLHFCWLSNECIVYYGSDGVNSWLVGAAKVKPLCLPHLGMRATSITRGLSMDGYVIFGSDKYLLAGEGRPTLVLAAQLVAFAKFDGREYLVTCQRAQEKTRRLVVNELDLYENGKAKYTRPGVSLDCDEMDDPIYLCCVKEMAFVIFRSGKMSSFDMIHRKSHEVERISSSQIHQVAGNLETGLLFHTKHELVYAEFAKSGSDVPQVDGAGTGEEEKGDAAGPATTRPDEAPSTVDVEVSQPAVERAATASLDLIQMKHKLHERDLLIATMRRELDEKDDTVAAEKNKVEELAKQLEHVQMDLEGYRRVNEVKGAKEHDFSEENAALKLQLSEMNHTLTAERKKTADLAKQLELANQDLEGYKTEAEIKKDGRDGLKKQLEEQKKIMLSSMEDEIDKMISMSK